MNKKIVLCVIIAFSVVLLSFIPFYQTFRVHNVWEIKNDQFFIEQKTSAKNKIFILGGSAVGQLNTTVVNEMISNNLPNYEVYNLAYNGDLPTLRIQSVDATINAKPKTVFYGISYWSLADYHEKKNTLDFIIKNLFNVDSNTNSINPKAATLNAIKITFGDETGLFPEAKIKLKETEAYKTRFKGNELRRAKGLNVLSEVDYLLLENSYSETLKAYGLQNYFGSAATKQDKKNRDLKLADIIGNDVSAVEFKDRVSTAVDRVQNADAYTKTAFKQFYNINDTDLIGYFLDPTKALPTLKEKAAAAEIGGAALGQNLAATSATAEELARFGVTREQAVQGYANIAEILPTAQKLSSIYSQEGITYGQTEAEQETFKGLASEQRKRKQLAAREAAAFGGSSGTALSAGALSTQYLRKGSSAGQF